MEYRCQTADDAVTAALIGRLTFEDHAAFRLMMADLSKDTATRWVVDMTKLDFIDSAGLGLLLRAKASAEKENRNLILRVPKDGKIRKMLDIAHFDQLIPYES